MQKCSIFLTLNANGSVKTIGEFRGHSKIPPLRKKYKNYSKYNYKYQYKIIGIKVGMETLRLWQFGEEGLLPKSGSIWDSIFSNIH